MATSSYEVSLPLTESRIQEHFSKHAELYVDKTLACYEQASLQRLAALATVTGFDSMSSFRLLDVGCGGGFFLDLFLQLFAGATACGVDFCPEMLQANTSSNRKMVKQGNALDVPEDCGDFEVINIDTVLHHLVRGRSYEQTLGQIEKCLTHLQSRLMPGGVLCIREIYHEYLGCESLGTRIIFFLSTLSVPRFVERILRFAGIHTANAGVCFLTRKQWQEMFQSAGLSILSIEEKAWPGQPYRRFGFKASGDVYYILSPKRPYV
jgi:SAM-dependent methyltransferase